MKLFFLMFIFGFVFFEIEEGVGFLIGALEIIVFVVDEEDVVDITVDLLNGFPGALGIVDFVGLFSFGLLESICFVGARTGSFPDNMSDSRTFLL